MRFNLLKTFPLLTTKKVLWVRGFEELLWFISGSTNAKVLQKKKKKRIHIWVLVEVPGARYIDMHVDYTGQ